LLHRAKRWLQGHMVRTRITQLSELIDRIEDGIAQDHGELASLRMEIATASQRLRYLTQPTHQRTEATP
jgi:chromosome segregation ATPase